MNNKFAFNLKQLRIKAGMTQKELADKLEKDYSTIGKWELGQRAPIMMDVIKISKLFNVPIETLITGSIIENSKKRTEEEQKEALKQILKSEGILDENENMSIEDFNRLISFIEKNKEFLIKK